ncbi:hypothetical protein OGAPHI_006458 [Ogataea philodendri]|uniref:Uncharacterized protein n=1 Tax=Ogataea philodendri TaxID=1378263 RepID=A0A9P8T164_9ASCO|nr:uncharacterized protein OGAPHI_006458 [Ogataea philodendri]KAH3661610.1 hypothetical protein OGAPHI_006458 [Ogataea philodendri]
MDRRAALEAKRAKLEELRRQRLEREPVGLGHVEQVEQVEQKKPVVPEQSVVPVVPVVPVPTVVPVPPVPPVLLDKSTATDELDELALRNKLEREISHRLELEITQKLRKEYELKASLQASLQISKPDLTHILGSDIPPQNENINSVYAVAKQEPEIANSFVSSQTILSHPETKEMAVTSIDWSPHYPELVAVSYVCPNKACVILVWNTLTSVPEFSLQTYTDINIVKFIKSQSNQLAAGGNDGRLYLYTFDSATKYPVTSTTTSAKYPIVSILETSNSIVSVSADGVVLVHSKSLVNLVSQSMLALPGKFLITASAIKQNHLLVGLSSGKVYKFELGSLNDASNIQLLFETGAPLPVVCIDFNSKLTAASALDYQVKIRENDETTQISTPIVISDLSIDRESHTFITASPNGTLAYWDLAANKHSSLGTMNLGVVLNRVQWNNNGKCFACGSTNGNLYLETL